MHLPVDDCLVRNDSAAYLAATTYFDLSSLDGAGDQTADNEDVVRFRFFGRDDVSVYRTRRRHIDALCNDIARDLPLD